MTLEAPNRQLAIRFASAPILALFAFSVSGCTASLPADGSGPLGTGQPPALVVASPEGPSFPAWFVREVHEETGVLLTEVNPQNIVDETDVDEVTDLEPGGPAQADAVLYAVDPAENNLGGTQIGVDANCLLVDTAWFGANALPVPADLGEGDEGVESGSILLTVRPQWVPTEGQPRWERIDEPCVSTGVFLVASDAISERASRQLSKVQDFLLSQPGQLALARSGIAFPLEISSGDSIYVVSTDDKELEVTYPELG